MNPFEDLVPATDYQPQLQSQTQFQPTSPFSDLLPASIEPLNGTIEDGNKEPELKGWEAEWARKSPNSYGFLRAFVIDQIPFAKYALPSEQESFQGLEVGEQRQALLWEGVGAALMVGAPFLGKGMKWMAGKVGKGLGGRLFASRAAKVVPFEDAVRGIKEAAPGWAYEPFSYRAVVKGEMKKLGMNEVEVEGLTNALVRGDSSRLVDTVLDVKMGGKESSKAFQEATEPVLGGLYPKLKVRDSFGRRYSEDLVRAKYHVEQFEDVLAKEVLGIKKKELKGGLGETVFRAKTKMLWPEAAESMEFGTVGTEEMSNIILDMLSHKFETKRLMIPGSGRLLPMSLLPQRVAFGLGEATLGTSTHVYNPTKMALEVANKDNFNKIFTFTKMLEQAKLVKVKLNPNTGEFKFGKVFFTREEQLDAHRRLLALDDISGKLLKAEGEELAALEARKLEALSGLQPGSPVKALMDVWDDYSNFLYGDYVKGQIPRLFRRAGLSEAGQSMLDGMMRKVSYDVDSLFSTAGSRNVVEQVTGMKKLLEEVRGLVDPKQGPVQAYFMKTGAQLNEVLQELGKNLTYGKGGFMRYRDNYLARLSENGQKFASKWSDALLSKSKSFFTKARLLEQAEGPPADFMSMIEARTYAQSKELYLYDALEQVVNYAKRLPPAWAETTEHLLARVLNKPSIMDHKTADFLTRTVGAFERRVLGKEGVWDARRTIRLAQNINNVTYMGALGFKPFSVIRNLFQPLLLVPADLGGMKDLGTLMKGMVRAFKPDVRKQLNGMGIIAEFAPEISFRPKALPFGKSFFGVEEKHIEAVRDVSMWMFRGSDRWNRYVTGAAALTKWEGALKKVGGVLRPENLRTFSKAVGLKGRNPWKTTEIEDLLRRGKHTEAMNEFVRDVVADTQYLYGGLDSPTAMSSSALGRTGFIFQSWWMNYASTLEKWVRTGGTGVAKMDKLFAAMASAAIAEQMMEGIWGRKTAIRAVGLGPVPGEISEYTIPPLWTPLYHGLAAISNLQEPDISVRHVKSILGTLPVLLPGGLQLKQFVKGASKEGAEGVLKAIVRYRKDED